MPLEVTRFPPPVEAQFRAARRLAIAEVNGTTYPLVALFVLAFAWWDWYVDPVNWRTAFAIRVAGALVILATGIVQRVSGRVDWAPALGRARFAAAVLAVAGALAVIERGFVVGLAGLVAVMLSGPYIAIDRRDVLKLNALPLAGIAAIMWLTGTDRFATVNAWTFILLSVAVSLLLARVFESSNRRAFALERQLTQEARSDSLTGLLNRRALEEIAASRVSQLERGGAPLCAILCDVDHFKLVNDEHGHVAGDTVIREVGERLRSVLREHDALGRWGGEEFLALLPDTTLRDAQLLAERVRATVESSPMPIAGVRVTISAGVAALPDGPQPIAERWTALVKAADDAMYRAKAAGRNRVVVATDVSPP